MFIIGFDVIKMTGVSLIQVLASALQYCPPPETKKQQLALIWWKVLHVFEIEISFKNFFELVQDEGMYFKASTACTNMLID